MFFPVPPRPEKPAGEGTNPPQSSPDSPPSEPTMVTETVLAPERSGLRVALGVLLGAAVLIASAVRLPSVFESAANSDYDRSYLYSTIGFTLLFAALSLWLMRTGLWPRASNSGAGRRAQPTRSRSARALILVAQIAGGAALGILIAALRRG